MTKKKKSTNTLAMSENKGKTKTSSACGPRSAIASKEYQTTLKASPEAVAEETLLKHGRKNKYWPKGVTPYPHQMEAVEFALARLAKHTASYLALEAGLGKTICAALILNRLQETTPTKAFYVCPPFLTSNTRNEFEKWCFNPDLYLIPDSMLARKASAGKTVEALKEELENWDGDSVLYIDEGHRFKNETSGRSKILYTKIIPLFKKIVWLSGTPLPNSRGKEFWPVAKNTAPEIFGNNFFKYALKYCGAFKGPFGWDFDGFTNRKEWRARVTKSFLLRMKKDVIELPPKREGLLTVGDGMPPVVSKVEREILKHYTPEDLVQGKIAAANKATSLHLATYLRLLGEYKLKYALPYIENLLEDTKENILIFAVHKETIAKLQYALADYKPLVITGDVPKDKRQGLVKLFQESKEHRVFILNIVAGGVGFTLTKASRVLFVEYSWVDGDNSQASDRAHRIGQTSSVLVQYVVLKDSIDARRMEVLLNKRRLSI